MSAPSLRRQRFAWCLFDFANSAFNTVVVTFVYAQFFARGLVGDARRGEALWGFGAAAAGVLIALASPVLGGLADRTAHKRRYLVVGALVTVAATALLFLPHADPATGRASGVTVAAALGLVVVATVAFEVMFVFYNAFLPQLAPPDRIGRLSGFGWASGYVGGLLCLVLCLGLVDGFGRGAWLPTEGDLHLRATNLVVAGWFLLFALPMFFSVRDGPAPAPVAGRVGSLRAAWATVRALPRQPDLLRLLVARLFYNDALIALIQLSGLYMATTLGMAPAEILTMGIGLNVVAGLGAVAFGYVDDGLGAKTALVGSLVLLISGALLALLWPTRAAFIVAAGLVGLGMGPNQAASRTMLARFVDPRRSAEYFGLFALSGKATVWLGPLLFALIRTVSDEQRLAFLPLLVMFALGLGLLLTVDEKRGVAAARGPNL